MCFRRTRCRLVILPFLSENHLCWLQHCSSLGQFLPLGGSNPVIGKVGELELVEEDRVEVLVNDVEDKRHIMKAVEEMKKVSHDLYSISKALNTTFWKGTSLRR